MPELNVWASRNLYWVSKSTKIAATHGKLPQKKKNTFFFYKYISKFQINCVEGWFRKLFSSTVWAFRTSHWSDLDHNGHWTTKFRINYMCEKSFKTDNQALCFQLLAKKTQINSTYSSHPPLQFSHRTFCFFSGKWEILRNTFKVQVGSLPKLELTIKTLSNGLPQPKM